MSDDGLEHTLAIELNTKPLPETIQQYRILQQKSQ
jgi:hypothetical protein